MSVENQIKEAEERLRLAMLHSDVEALNVLISPELVFTTHLGSVVTKQDDLKVHRTGELKFRTLEPSEQRIMSLGHVAYVSVRMRLSGVDKGALFQGDLRFSRLWRISEGNTWQVVAGHVTAVQP